MKSKKRLLITGVSGHLGSNLAYCLKDTYEILGLYHSRRVSLKGIQARWADLRSLSHTEAVVREFNPHIIIHCAAQADVDSCEMDPEHALEANVISTANLVKTLEGLKAKFVQISTDLVYDGGKGQYTEIDKAKPVNYYGITKLDAEREALKSAGALVLRTNFFGWGMQPKRSLAQWVMAQLKNKEAIQGFTDVMFSSLYTFDLADIIHKAIKKDLKGIYNCGSSTAMSKYDFLRRIAQKTELDAQLIQPVSVEQFPFKAKRAKNLSLDVAKLSRDLGEELPTIETAIDHFIRDVDKNYPASMLSELEKTSYRPYLNFIPYGRQAIDDEDVKAVSEVLISPNLTQGPKIEEFERKLAKYVTADFCVAVNSGTSALHIACLAAGVTEGDEVITSPNTFVASANCAAYCGARPVFADIDDKTYNLSPEAVEQRISARTKAVIAVHFAGQSADMEAIKEIVNKAEKKFGHKIYIIEDASHALGSQYKGTRVGCCFYSDMTVFSFHPVKHITTGEGGAVLTNDKALHRKFCLYRSHGITTFPDEFIQQDKAFDPGDNEEKTPVRRSWYYEQQYLGFNYRITDLQGALGLTQLKKLPEFIKRRRAIVEQYNEAFAGIKTLRTPFESTESFSNFHLYVLLFDFVAINKTRNQVISELRDLGILTQVHYIPVHTQPFHQREFGSRWGDCPKAERYYEKCLSIPLFPAMTDAEIQKVITAVKKVIGVHEHVYVS